MRINISGKNYEISETIKKKTIFEKLESQESIKDKYGNIYIERESKLFDIFYKHLLNNEEIKLNEYDEYEGYSFQRIEEELNYYNIKIKINKKKKKFDFEKIFNFKITQRSSDYQHFQYMYLSTVNIIFSIYFIFFLYSPSCTFFNSLK
jgi:ribosome-associated translation inhibitor RaiA